MNDLLFSTKYNLVKPSIIRVMTGPCNSTYYEKIFIMNSKRISLWPTVCQLPFLVPYNFHMIIVHIIFIANSIIWTNQRKLYSILWASNYHRGLIIQISANAWYTVFFLREYPFIPKSGHFLQILYKLARRIEFFITLSLWSWRSRHCATITVMETFQWIWALRRTS